MRLLDERAAWFYEAVINDEPMHGQKTGKDQVYMATCKDGNGDWLDGGNNCVLRLPADVPAGTFWSLPIYEVSTRTLVQNEHGVADRASACIWTKMTMARWIFLWGRVPPWEMRRRTGFRQKPTAPGSRVSGCIHPMNRSSTEAGHCQISRRPRFLNDSGQSLVALFGHGKAQSESLHSRACAREDQIMKPALSILPTKSIAARGLAILAALTLRPVLRCIEIRKWRGARVCCRPICCSRRIAVRLFACILMLGVCVSILEPGTAFGEASTDAPVVAEVKQSDIEVSVLDWRVLGLSSEELSDVADVWQGHLAANLNAISMVATGKIAEGSADRVNAPNLSELLIQNDTILDRYAIVLSAWERKGGSEAEIERHRAFMRGSSAQLLRSIDLLTFLATVFHWVFSWRGGLSLFVQLGITIVGFILILVLARVVRRVVDRRIERKGNVAVLGKVLARNMAFWVTLLFGVLFVLVRNGANLTTIATIVGGLGFLLAVAMQNALGNVASGILIMLFRPFDIGDVVRFGELVGTVEGLETSATLVRKFDNLLVRIPNEEVWKNRVSNFSVPDLLRVELVFNIGFPQDQEKAIAVLLNVAKREPSCRQTPQPEVFVAEVGEASIGIYCRAWVDPADYWSTAWALTAAGVEALHRSGIQIATPFYDVKLHNPTGSVAQIG